MRREKRAGGRARANGLHIVFLGARRQTEQVSHVSRNAAQRARPGRLNGAKRCPRATCQRRLLANSRPAVTNGRATLSPASKHLRNALLPAADDGGKSNGPVCVSSLSFSLSLARSLAMAGSFRVSGGAQTTPPSSTKIAACNSKRSAEGSRCSNNNSGRDGRKKKALIHSSSASAEVALSRGCCSSSFALSHSPSLPVPSDVIFAAAATIRLFVLAERGSKSAGAAIKVRNVTDDGRERAAGEEVVKSRPGTRTGPARFLPINKTRHRVLVSPGQLFLAGPFY